MPFAFHANRSRYFEIQRLATADSVIPFIERARPVRAGAGFDPKAQADHEETHPRARLDRARDDGVEDEPEQQEQDRPKVSDLVADLEAEAEEEEAEEPLGGFRLRRSCSKGVNFLMMQALKAQVKNGRLVLDEPTDLPEGEIVELVPVDEVLASSGDYLDDEERERLHAALEISIKQAQEGKLIDADEVMTKLRAIR